MDKMLNKPGIFTRAYTRNSLIQLFLICALPLHIWAFLMALRDFGWVAARTYVWDAVGMVAYALVFALVETMGVFLIVILLGLLVPRRWEEELKLALIGTLFLIVAVWSILGQVYSLFGHPLPVWAIDYLVQSGHPFRIIWGATLLVVGFSVILPAYLILKLNKVKDLMVRMFDQITVLSAFYVLCDLVGIIIIVIRNIRL